MATTATKPPAPDTTEISAGSDTGPWVALKSRIKTHYDLLSEYYYSLWGEHIHHGYFTEDPSDTKEAAQRRLISLLLERSNLSSSLRVLDVGCGVGGTSRHLALEHACNVTGVTISGKQVEIAKRLSHDEAAKLAGNSSGTTDAENAGEWTSLPPGKVRFIELDAEKMGEYFDGTIGKEGDFDAVWISEAMSHLPHKQLFFDNAFKLLKSGGQGKLVVADWFKAEELTEQQMRDDIKPIEDGMLLPPLCTMAEYVSHAEIAGFRVYSEPFDISDNVKKTWDISLSLVQNPSLWMLAIAAGRDIISFLRAFQAMRRGYSNRTFKYAVMVFEKA
ncbi:Cycloartenol-C-24-methyltransferase [Dactylellina cionopaga]|nr:Cycloartenol-C-24-methyltransferase [Dactylellina cionopaga]